MFKVQSSKFKVLTMATFKTFEEIDCWQKARILSSKIYDLTQTGTFNKDYKHKDQINGASGSIMDNIAEGLERGGTREFIQFLSIAKASAGEVRSQLYRALDRKHISQEQFDSLKEEVLQISKLIAGLIKYLNNSNLKGVKYAQEPGEIYGEPDPET